MHGIFMALKIWDMHRFALHHKHQNEGTGACFSGLRRWDPPSLPKLESAQGIRQYTDLALWWACINGSFNTPQPHCASRVQAL